MAQLVTANQFQLTPDVVGSISRGMSLAEQIRGRKLQEAKDQFLSSGGMQSPQAMEESAKLGLDFQRQVASGLGLIDERTQQVDQNRLNEAADFAFSIQNLPLEAQNKAIQDRINKLEAEGRDATQTKELLEDNEQDRATALNTLQLAALPNEARIRTFGAIRSGKVQRSQFLKDGTAVMIMDDQSVKVVSPSGEELTGAEAEQRIRDVRSGELESKLKAQREGLDIEREKAQIEVEAAREKARATGREKTIADIRADYSERRKNAAREQLSLTRALNLAARADQGLTADLKLGLSKLIPGIDVSNEAGLDTALKQLTLNQLANFKGPTTDFEYGVAESIVGGVGQSKAANEARLKSLMRANWFNDMESKQFKRYTDEGGDPLEFQFNFNDSVSTARGDVSLQDLLDTAVENNMTIEEVLAKLNAG